MSKTLNRFLLAGAALALLAGCAAPVAAPAAPAAEPAATAETAPAEAATDGPIRVAVMLPSTINDMSWSQSIIDSLNAVQAELGADALEIAYSENMWNVTDAAPALRDYADAGFDIVFAHGAQYGTTIMEIAPEFPETSFAWGTTTNFGAEEGLTNVFAYEPRADEGGYVLGVIAATLTKSNIIGLVGPVDAGDAKLHVDGFLAGVKATNPDAQVNVTFTGNFGDTALAAEAANTQINAGAVGVAAEKGVPWLGIQGDQSPLAPEVVVATALYDWTGTIKEILKLRSEGVMGGQVLQLTLANGGQSMVYADSLAPEALEAANAAAAGIIDGSIEIVAEARQ
jgi:basic membrane protein A